MTTDAAPETAPVLDRSVPGTIGTLLTRIVVPLWVLAGASFKLWERDPRILPQPIFDTIGWLGRLLSLDDAGFASLLVGTFRMLIGIELVLVAVMLFVPVLARKAAIFVLSVFCLILLCVLTTQLMADGWEGIKEGSCGCFGTSGPKPWMMFIIDFAMLLGVILFRPNPTRNSAAGVALGFIGAILGMSLALLTPDKSFSVPEPEPVANGGSAVDTPQSPDGGTGADGTPSTGWPAPPQLENFYFPQFEDWIGTPLRTHPLAQLINRPLPEGFDTGRWHVVFYRGNCAHCHELIERDIVGDLVARTVLVRVPDTDPSEDQMLPDRPFVMHHLPVGPNWVFTTPVLLTVVDGVVTGLATDVEDQDQVQAALEAGPVTSNTGPDDADGPSGTSDSARGSAGTGADGDDGAGGAAGGDGGEGGGGASTADASAWPPAPPPENFYFPQFENWVGTRLDANPVALQIQPPRPDLNEGLWHLVFYRGNCHNCHDLIATYITGDLVENTLLVRVPDTDPAEDEQFPDRPFVMSSLLEGPQWVITTPVLLTVKDGTVVAAVLDSENVDEVEAALAAE